MEPGIPQIELSKLLNDEWDPWTPIESEKKSFESDDAESQISNPTQIGVFDNQSLERRYKPAESYEGAHRWDPDFQWNAQEEARVIRKIDLRIGLWVSLMFFAYLVERGNVSLAPSKILLDGLHLTAEEYDTGQAIYSLTAVLAVLPSQSISTRLGANIWMPILMVSWGLLATLQSGLHSRNAFWTSRALIGLCEGGFTPSMVLYLSGFYTSAELPIRLSYLWASYPSFSIIAMLAGSFIAHESGLRNIPALRWLPGLEGALTCVIGFSTYLYLPRSPTQTGSRFRGGKGWFTTTEEKILINRLLRDDPSKGDAHNRDPLTLNVLKQCLTNYQLWPIYLLGLSWNLSVIPAGTYAVENLRAIGFEHLELNVLTVPACTIWVINILIFTGMSEWFNERLLLSSLSQIWVFPLVMCLLVLPEDRWRSDTWILTGLAVAQPYVHAILNGLASRNAGSAGTRTVAVAVYNMCFQVSQIVGTSLCRKADAPFYHHGNKILVFVTVYNFFLFIATKRFYVNLNRRRRIIWNSMSIGAKEKYIATTRDEGNQRLDFRFAH